MTVTQYAAPTQFPSSLSLEALLGDHLQDADWMLEPSLITSVNFPGDVITTLLDQDPSTIHNLRLTSFSEN